MTDAVQSKLQFWRVVGHLFLLAGLIILARNLGSLTVEQGVLTAGIVLTGVLLSHWGMKRAVKDA